MMAEENEVGISPALVAPALSILKEFYSSLSGRNKKKFQKTLRSIHAYIHIYTHGVRIEEYSDSMIKLLLEIKDDPFFYRNSASRLPEVGSHVWGNGAINRTS